MAQMQMTPEQQEAFKKKLESMSPEELKEFQKKQCIFCQIIGGKVASRKVYEDETVLAVLDINPANPGHLLILPKEHYAIMPQIPDNEIGRLAMVTKALSQVLLKVLKAEGTNIFVANGLVAGQKAQHFMLHLIPRKEKDGVEIDFPEGILKEDEAKRLVNRLKPMIEKVLGKGKVEEKKEEKEEAKAEKPEAPKGEKKPERYMTSAKAKRFHLETCPFAAKIQEGQRIYFTLEEAEKAGYKPCKCTGLLGKAPEEVGREAVKKAKKEKVEKKIMKELKKEKEKRESKEKEAGKEESKDESSLDDISKLLTGK